MVIKKDDIEMSVKNTKFKLSSNGGISISFNGMENTTITKDTATFKDSVGNSHQFNA